MALRKKRHRGLPRKIRPAREGGWQILGEHFRRKAFLQLAPRVRRQVGVVAAWGACQNPGGHRHAATVHAA
jgi:hypothetical protein